MWSHYADSHRGVCLEWEVDEESSQLKGGLNEVIYEDELVTLNEVKRFEDGYLDLNISSNGKFILQKLKDWEYEEELRIYKFCEDSNLKGESNEFLGELTAIYFGKNAILDDIELVKFNSSHINGLKYYKVDMDTNIMKYNKLTQV